LDETNGWKNAFLPNNSFLTVAHYFHTQGFHVYSKVLGELTKRAPTIAAAPKATAVVEGPAPAASSAVETVFKAPADASVAVDATPVTPATPASEEVEGGWVCL